MEYFGQIITSGLLIGIFISAPMGPIGMLVIQRTLNKGRHAAFFTGIGAALSDLTYCLLTGLGQRIASANYRQHCADCICHIPVQEKSYACLKKAG